MQPAIHPFYVMEAMIEAEKLQKSGADIIHLSVGQPSTTLPQDVIERAKASLDDGVIGYTHSLGIEPLRLAISNHYRVRYGVDVPISRIAVTVGSSVGAALALMAAFSPGDEVGIGVPYYPAYPNMLRGLNLRPRFLRTTANTRYQVTPEQLAHEGEGIKGLMVASPSNPAGTIIAPDDLAALCRWCDSHDARLFSDEIYHGITFGSATADTALRYSERAVVINSFSKYFLMPGFRLGWVVMPEDIMRRYECLLQSFVISAPTVSQHVALAMFEHTDILDREVARYDTNRMMLMQACHELGFTDVSAAEGAFYLYASIGSLAENSPMLCKRLLHEAHVSIVPGLDFDEAHGDQTVRMSYCGDTERLRTAIARMKAWKQAQ
ncbi:MAG: 1-aminocyclopropane-1-carboxylate deaminase [Alphaproteobacteria bacterium]|nr:1-aminocyclopropane-1-carboxylate deaminase [Alphaproteobacteria bacterium]